MLVATAVGKQPVNGQHTQKTALPFSVRVQGEGPYKEYVIVDQRTRPFQIVADGFKTSSEAQAYIDSQLRHLTGKSFGGFLKAVSDARSDNLLRQRQGNELLEKVYQTGWHSLPPAVVSKSAMGETSGQVGGYLVPTEYSTALMNTLDERSFIYPRANIVPMGAAQTMCPVIDATTVQAAGISPVFGSVNFKWGFSQAPTEIAEPKFRQVTLTAWDMLGYGIVSNQWLQDTPGGEGELVKLMGKAAAWTAEYAFLRGTGSDSLMPLGILNSPALIAVTRAGSSHIAQADVAKMWRSLLPRSVPYAIWAVSPTAVEDLVKITGYSPNQGNTEDGAAGTIYTRPVYVTEKLPALGSVGDIVLFDPSLYAVGIRQEVLVDISADEPTTFVKNQSMMRVWMRMAGMPQLNSTVRLADASTVVSAYVALAA